MKDMIHMKALKYPNIPHYDWEGEVLEKTDDYIMVLCEAGRKLVHHTKNKVFTVKNASLEYFSLTQWYTAAVEIEDDKIKSYYCNVAMPSVIEDNEISFIDLDLDLVKEQNEDWKVVDEDEFEENSVTFNYPTELKNGALQALEQLKTRVEQKEFPFNKEILNVLKTISYHS